MQPLDVYVKQDIYEWFFQGKDYELRAPHGRFSPDQVVEGRPCIVHKGNSGTSSQGTVGNVIIGGLDEILGQVDFRRIAPLIQNEQSFRSAVQQLMGYQREYIAFEINLDDVSRE
jgi:hypothetical protein